MKVLHAVCAIVIVSFAWPVAADAMGARFAPQVPAAPSAPQQAPAPAPPPEKVQAPPLFPKHRRVLYLNGQGLWVIDSTPQSPPLETDDPGVPDAGAWEINFSTDADRTATTKTLNLFLVDANYGMSPTIFGREIPMEVTLEVPVSAGGEIGQPLVTAIGGASTGLKLNFYASEHHSMSVAFYPQVEFAPQARAVDAGLAEDGQTIVLPLLVSKEFNYMTMVFNAGANVPVHDASRHITGTFGLSSGLAITRKTALMAELHAETRFDFANDRLLTFNFGIMHALGHSLALFANVGHSLFSDDESHAYAGVGLKVLIEPSKK